MTFLKSFVVGWLRDPRFKLFLWFCLPALVVGLALRIWLTIDMPYAYFQPDSPDLLTTVDKLFHHGKFELHSKKTFLVPILYVGTYLIPKVPLLISIPLLQHLLGLIAIVLAGGIVRLWFRFWKWVIIPVTMIMAVHPSFLWYEHTLMAESIYVFCTVLLALVGTIYALRPTTSWFIALCVALVLEAGSRPEGKLFFAFALLLIVLLHWGKWAVAGRYAGILVILGILTHLITRTSQAGLLLFISVLRMAPDDLKCAPGIMEKMQPLRAGLVELWNDHNTFPRARQRKTAASIVKDYIDEKMQREHLKKEDKPSNEGLCQKMAKEIIIRRWWLMPRYALAKFEHSVETLPSGLWTDDQLLEKQIDDVYVDEMDLVEPLSKRLFGEEMKTLPEVRAWVEKNYSSEKVLWFMTLQDHWEHVVIKRPQRVADGSLSGVPYFYWWVVAGVLATLLTTLPQWKFQLSWAVMIVGLAFVIILTANVKSRFRLVFEPFYFLYLAGMIDLALTALTFPFKKKNP